MKNKKWSKTTMTGQEKYLVVIKWGKEDTIHFFHSLHIAKQALLFSGDRKAGITKITMWPCPKF